MKKSTMDAIDRAYERAQRTRRRQEAKRARELAASTPTPEQLSMDFETVGLNPYDFSKIEGKILADYNLQPRDREEGGGLLQGTSWTSLR